MRSTQLIHSPVLLRLASDGPTRGSRQKLRIPLTLLSPRTPSLAMASHSSLSCESAQAECAHVPSFCESCSPSPESSSPFTLESPSIYATFKVLQLVNAFRRKITRKHSAQASTKKLCGKQTSAEDFCQDFERQAFEEIDRYLGRKTRGRSSKPRKPTAFATGTKPAGKSIERYALQPDLPDEHC